MAPSSVTSTNPFFSVSIGREENITEVDRVFAFIAFEMLFVYAAVPGPLRTKMLMNSIESIFFIYFPPKYVDYRASGIKIIPFPLFCDQLKRRGDSDSYIPVKKMFFSC